MSVSQLLSYNELDLYCNNITPKSIDFDITYYGCIAPTAGKGTATRIGNLCFVRLHRVYEIQEINGAQMGLFFDAGTIPLGYRPNVDNDAQGYPIFLLTQETNNSTEEEIRYQSLGVLLPDGSLLSGRGMQLEPYSGVGYTFYLGSTMLIYPTTDVEPTPSPAPMLRSLSLMDEKVIKSPFYKTPSKKEV